MSSVKPCCCLPDGTLLGIHGNVGLVIVEGGLIFLIPSVEDITKKLLIRSKGEDRTVEFGIDYPEPSREEPVGEVVSTEDVVFVETVSSQESNPARIAHQSVVTDGLAAHDVLQ